MNKVHTLIFMLVVAMSCHGQSIARQTIQVAGQSVHIGSSILMQSSTGQPSTTQNRQGFIQPPYFLQTKGIYKLKVYPSPTYGLGTVEFEFEPNDLLQVIDMNGQLVLSSNLSNAGSTNVLDLVVFSSGKYIIRIIRKGENIAEGDILKIK